MVSAKSSEVQSKFDVGKNYTGVDNPGFEASIGPRPLRYGFVLLYDLNSGWPSTLPVSGSTYGEGESKEIVLPFPPDSISMDEPAATFIRYTQNAGKYIERQGQLSKTITISGTTGFNPNPKLNALARGALPPNVIVDEEGPDSGLGKFIELRSLFREYWQIFSDPELLEWRDKAAFIFINEKDDEAWLVEPMSFRMDRQTPRNKFTYNYNITLQTIAPLKDINLLKEELTFWQSVDAIVGVARSIADQIDRTSNVFGAAMAFATGAIRETVAEITNISTQVSGALSGIADGVGAMKDLGEVIKGNAASVERSFQQVKEDFIALSEEDGSAEVPFEAWSAMSQFDLTYGLISGHNELFNQPFTKTWGDVIDRYDPAYGLGGTNTLLLNPLEKSGIKEVEILPGDDLQSISLRELSSTERFIELAVINNLKPPYISPTQAGRLPNTLAPGDSIVVPSPAGQEPSASEIKTTVFTDPSLTGDVLAYAAGSTQIDVAGKTWRINQWKGFTATVISGTGLDQSRIVLANTEDEFTVTKAWTTVPDTTTVIRFTLVRVGLEPKKSVNDQLLGRDIRLDPQSFDITLTPGKDIKLVDGGDNMSQAIQGKLKTKPRELPAHPTFGLGYEPGRKGSADAIISYRVAVQQTLLSDSRIRAVRNLVVSMERDIADLEGYVLLSGSPQSFSIDTRGGS